ncbi:MAG: hypothetical protein HOI35_16210 [Woeseia sp.]|nr:hypothetical protein [Woeseia sp.]MBT6211548.1 hypothetical protein [Woeseia sp.]
MSSQLPTMLPAVFAFEAAIYLWLSVRVSRASTRSSNNAIAYFLFLIGMMVAGRRFHITPLIRISTE